MQREKGNSQREERQRKHCNYVAGYRESGEQAQHVEAIVALSHDRALNNAQR